MMDLQVFNYESNSVRVVNMEGNPWFVVGDIIDHLGLGNVTEAMRRLDEDEFSSTEVIDTLGRTQKTYVVNEPGLYSLILGSRKPEARRFKRWVTHEVLPSIRRHGMYATPQTLEAMLQDPDTMIKTLQALKAEREQRQALEQKVEQDKPRVIFSQAVEASEDSVLIRDLATTLKQNGIDVGQNRLFAWMRDKGYLIKSGANRNMPTQYSMDRGWFEVQKRVIHVPDGDPKIRSTTKVTGKGQLYFVNKFMSDYQKAQ